MARNWPADLAPASFRGVPFFVKTEGLTDAACHVAVHTYVKSEDHDTEDMARKPRRYRIAGYVASDKAKSQPVVVRSQKCKSLGGASGQGDDNADLDAGGDISGDASSQTTTTASDGSGIGSE